MPLPDRRDCEEMETRVVSGRPTDEELALVRDSVILPHMLTIADRSMREVSRSQLPMKSYLLKSVQMLMDRVSLELFRVRREMKKRNIRMLAEEQADEVMYYRFVCRGYEERFGFVREVVRAELNGKLVSFASQVLNKPDRNGSAGESAPRQ